MAYLFYMNKDVNVSILGCTGSIGQNTISVINAGTKFSGVNFCALTGNNNIERLIDVALKLKPRFVATANGEKYKELKNGLLGTGIEVAAGEQAVLEAASMKADWIMNAIIGAAGVLPSFTAVKNSKILALANKETLVCAGTLFMKNVQDNNCLLLPVDSEHSALFQCLHGYDINDVEKLILTASGGPFYRWSLDQMRSATFSEAIKHPKWSMGDRISIDSASMFNKALELIEAKHMFGINSDKIDVVVHPQSIIHSMVEYIDGSIIAHLSEPDMRGAIGFALNYPDRKSNNSKKIDLFSIGALELFRPDFERFPAIRIAIEVMKRGGLFGAILNAAKEVALDRFIVGELGFLQMADLVFETINQNELLQLGSRKDYSLDDVVEVDALARRLSSNIKMQLNK